MGDEVVNFTRTFKANTAAAGTPLQIERLATPEVKLNKFTTLERLAEDSEAVKDYFYRNPGLKEIFTSEAFKKGDYLKNTNIAKATIESASAGKIFHFENGVPVGFTEGTTYYPKTHAHYGAYMGDHEKEVLDLYRTTFKDGKIPTTGVEAVLARA